MASPRSDRVAITPGSARAPRTPLSDEVIWRRLRDAGFDEESIKRRDKASLIAYITKLESEIYDLHHQMGLLILEKKEWVSKYEQVKASVESVELMNKRDQTLTSSTLAEAKKREANLNKALAIEKDCVANLEKTLHEMRTECAETKVAAEIKLSEARSMMEEAQNKFLEAEMKLHAGGNSEAEANRYHRIAERKLHEVEAREDDLRRRIATFKSDCDAKEKEILLERQSLVDRQKSLQQLQEKLLDGQALLNQREDYIFNRSQELGGLEKELESSKANIEKEISGLIVKKNNLSLNEASLSAREEAVIKKESELRKREEELLILQEKVASKKSDVVQKVAANNEAAFQARVLNFEAELNEKRKLFEEEMESKRRAWELREVDLSQRQDLILEKEHELEVQSGGLADKEKDLTEKTILIDEKESNLLAAEKEVQSVKTLVKKEKEEIKKMKLDLQDSIKLLEHKKKEVNLAEERLETMRNETNELMELERRLKEEIDHIRAQKQELEVEADELKAEKTKFENEWESIDEKREELRKRSEHIAAERLAIETFLKDERDCLKLEKDALRGQYKHNAEALTRDREAFMREIEHERSEWYSKIQDERADLLLDFEMQKRGLENRINKRLEELESCHKEKEKAFEEEKKKELQHIASLRDTAAKEMEQVKLEMQKLDNERREINLGREGRDKEWAELNISIEELKMQREKLEKQRESLHAEKAEILSQIEQLKKLEDLKAVPDRINASEIQELDFKYGRQKVSARRILQQNTAVQDAKLASDVLDRSPVNESVKPLPPVSSPFSWLKRYASMLERGQNKKRKQENGVAVTSSDEPCTPRIQQIESGDDHVLTSKNELAMKSLNKDPKDAEETTIYIDKIVTVQEVTSLNQEISIEESQKQKGIIR